jgi:hypothetical protein
MLVLNSCSGGKLIFPSFSLTALMLGRWRWRFIPRGDGVRAVEGKGRTEEIALGLSRGGSVVSARYEPGVGRVMLDVVETADSGARGGEVVDDEGWYKPSIGLGSRR